MSSRALGEREGGEGGVGSEERWERGGGERTSAAIDVGEYPAVWQCKRSRRGEDARAGTPHQGHRGKQRREGEEAGGRRAHGRREAAGARVGVGGR